MCSETDEIVEPILENSSQENFEEKSNMRKAKLKERARLKRREAYLKAKEKLKVFKKSPKFQEKLAHQKARQKELLKSKSTNQASKSPFSRKGANGSTSEIQRQEAARIEQEAKDIELRKLVRPALVLLKGGADN